MVWVDIWRVYLECDCLMRILWHSQLFTSLTLTDGVNRYDGILRPKRYIHRSSRQFYTFIIRCRLFSYISAQKKSCVGLLGFILITCQRLNSRSFLPCLLKSAHSVNKAVILCDIIAEEKLVCFTVDHSLMPHWTALSLSDRQQFVTLGGSRSEVGVISVWCSSGGSFGPFTLLLILHFSPPTLSNKLIYYLSFFWD